MGCGHVPPGHWGGVLSLTVGFVLSLIGVASPAWRVLDTEGRTVYEGLWQHCDTQREHAGEISEPDSECIFSEVNHGLWRAIQVLKIMTLAFLFIALIFSFIVCSCRKRPPKLGDHRKCPNSAIAALTGGIIGFVSDLMYVGYMERHATDLRPGEVMYAWSFGLSIGGSLFSLMSSLIIYLSVKICSPKYVSYSVEPYDPGEARKATADNPSYFVTGLGDEKYLVDAGLDGAKVKRNEFGKRGRSAGGGMANFFPDGLVYPPFPPPDYPYRHPQEVDAAGYPRVLMGYYQPEPREHEFVEHRLKSGRASAFMPPPQELGSREAPDYPTTRGRGWTMLADEEVDRIMSGNITLKPGPNREVTTEEMLLRPPTGHHRRSKSAHDAVRWSDQRDSGGGSMTPTPVVSTPVDKEPAAVGGVDGGGGGNVEPDAADGAGDEVRKAESRGKGLEGKRDGRAMEEVNGHARIYRPYVQDRDDHAPKTGHPLSHSARDVSRPYYHRYPDQFERLVWRRRSSLPEALNLGHGDLAHHATLPYLRRPAPPRYAPVSVWLRNPRQERLVIKQRRQPGFQL